MGQRLIASLALWLFFKAKDAYEAQASVWTHHTPPIFLEHPEASRPGFVRPNDLEQRRLRRGLLTMSVIHL